MIKFVPLCLIFLTACSVSRLDHYPGKDVASFPEQMQGEYRLQVGGLKGFFTGKQLDSARVRISPNIIESLNEKGWQTEFAIDSASALSKLDVFYFLSKKDPVEPLFWNATILWGNEKDIYLTPVNSTDKNLQNDHLKNYLTLTLLVRKNNQAQVITIPSTDKKLMAIANSVSPESKDSILYYQVTDTQMLKFLKKEWSTKNALRFTRIKQPKATK